jgi:hypothetical protein
MRSQKTRYERLTVEQLQHLLTTYRDNLYRHLDKKAARGDDISIDLARQIEETENEIKNIEDEIEKRYVSIHDITSTQSNIVTAASPDKKRSYKNIIIFATAIVVISIIVFLNIGIHLISGTNTGSIPPTIETSGSASKPAVQVELRTFKSPDDPNSQDNSVDITNYANETIQKGISGFPFGDQEFTANKGSGPKVKFVIPKGDNRIDTKCQNYDKPTSVTINIAPLPNVSYVYFLINAGFTTDHNKEEIGNIKLIFSDGTQTKPNTLILGWNIREWRISAAQENIPIVTVTTNDSVQEVYKDAIGVVDLLTIEVGSEFAYKELVGIIIEDTSDPNPCLLISGITVRTIISK